MTKDTITGLAIGTENYKHRTEFTKNEMDALRELHTSKSMEFEDLDEQLSEIKKEFKDKMKVVTSTKKQTMQSIRKGFQEKDVEVYLVPDLENDLMELYDANTFEKLDVRKIRPDERSECRQLKIHSQIKTA